MPTATLTWSAPHGSSNPMSTFVLTRQGGIQLLNQYFTALAVFADFPWTVCSYEGTTAPWFVTLKRKSGAPGRIVFIAVTSPPGATYNPQLGNLSWNAAGVRAAWFPEATSDTPANILSLSGDVFTNPGLSTGLGVSYDTFSGGTFVFDAWACDDGIFIRYGTPGNVSRYWAIGDLLEDDLGNAFRVCYSALSFDSITPNVNPAISDSGGLLVSGTNTLHFGTGWMPVSSPSAYMRDNTLKRSWFLPRAVACLELPAADIMKYKFRQIAIGPNALAADEQLTDTGAVLKAFYTFPNTGSGYPWLTNFKV